MDLIFCLTTYGDEDYKRPNIKVRRVPMPVSRPALLFISTLLLSPGLAAQQSPLQSVFAALGSSIPSLPSSYTASGTITQFGSDSSSTSYSVQIEALGSDKFRWVLGTPSGPVTNIINGTAGQTRSPVGTKPIPATDFFGHSLANFPVLALGQWLGAASIHSLSSSGCRPFTGLWQYESECLSSC